MLPVRMRHFFLWDTFRFMPAFRMRERRKQFFSIDYRCNGTDGGQEWWPVVIVGERLHLLAYVFTNGYNFIYKCEKFHKKYILNSSVFYGNFFPSALHSFVYTTHHLHSNNPKPIGNSLTNVNFCNASISQQSETRMKLHKCSLIWSAVGKQLHHQYFPLPTLTIVKT